jgi:hypothetical protein
MPTPNDVNGVRKGPASSLVRFVICLVGLAAVVWGAFALPTFWQEASPTAVASKLREGRTFKMQSLVSEARQAEAADRESFCNPTALRDLVILRLAIFNETRVTSNQALADSSYDTLHNATRKALSCAPAESFAWLTLFWLEAGKHGFKRENANYLRLSYALSPNESWIALWRTRLAFALFEQLPADLSDDAIDGFIKLLDTGRLTWQAAEIFERAPPVAQNRIIESLKTALPISRRGFAEALRNKGLDVVIPGETPRETRCPSDGASSIRRTLQPEKQGAQQDSKIEPKAPVIDIPKVEFDSLCH